MYSIDRSVSNTPESSVLMLKGYLFDVYDALKGQPPKRNKRNFAHKEADLSHDVMGPRQSRTSWHVETRAMNHYLNRPL